MRAAYLRVIRRLAELQAVKSRDAGQPAKLAPARAEAEQPQPDQSQAGLARSDKAGSRDETITVTGTVTDAAGKPMAGVSIFVSATPNGTATDPKGHFELRDIPSPAELQFSMIGYETERDRKSTRLNSSH